MSSYNYDGRKQRKIKRISVLAMLIVCVSVGTLSACGNGGGSVASGGKDNGLSAADSQTVDSWVADGYENQAAEEQQIVAGSSMPAGNPLDFEDDFMAKCVLEQAGYTNPDAVPTDELCESITELDTSGYAVATLADLQYMPNLEILTVDHSMYGYPLDLEGLDKATKLKRLTLFDCGVTDVTGIAKLTNLEYLDLSSSGYYTTDFSPLSALTNLKYLDISDVGNYGLGHPDGAFLDNLTALEELNLYRTGLSDYSLSNLSELKRLTISDCNLDDILEQLERSGALSKLEYLDAAELISLSEDGISSRLSKAVSLEEMRLYLPGVTTLSGFSNLQNLRILYLDNDTSWEIPLSDWDEIGALKNLEMLTLTHYVRTEVQRQPDDYAFLNNLSNLKRLCIYPYDGMSISCFQELDNLEVLNIDASDGTNSYVYTEDVVVDITGIGNFSSLKELNYRGVQFESIDPLEGLDSLSVNDMGSDQILYFWDSDEEY